MLPQQTKEFANPNLPHLRQMDFHHFHLKPINLTLKPEFFRYYSHPIQIDKTLIKQFTIISLLDIFHNYYATRLLLNGFITLEYIKRIFQNYLNDFLLRQSSHSVCFPRKNCSRSQEDICEGVHKVRDQLISFVDSFSRICSNFKSYFTINYTLTILTVLFQHFSR